MPKESPPGPAPGTLVSVEEVHPLRARVEAGVAVGAGTGLLLALIEALYVALALPLAFDVPLERAGFLLSTVGLLLGWGVVLGGLGGLWFGVLDGLAVRANARGRSAARLTAAAWALLASPALGTVAVLAFRGRRMQALPAPGFLATLAALVAVALTGIFAWQVAAAYRRVSRRKSPVLADIFAALLLVLAVGLHHANTHILPRLYGFFHVGLSAATALACALAGALVLSRVRRPSARWPFVVLALLGVVMGRVALTFYAYWPVLRAVAFEDTPAQARLLGIATALRLAPRAIEPPEHLPPAPPPAALALPTGPRFPDADIFLITVDAMRGDRLTPSLTPRLSALAEEGVVFDHAYSQVPHTSFSLTTLLTGKYAYSLAALGDPLAGHDTLANLFKKERYKTAAFFPPSVFFIDHDRFAALEASRFRFDYVKYEYMDAPGRTDQVIRFLETEKPQRTFVWVHYFEPHEPYEEHEYTDGGVPIRVPRPDGGSPPPYRPGPNAPPAAERYDGEIRFVDCEVARLIDWVREHRQRAIVVFTADHGEEFGEHGGRYHGSTLYEEQVRVPLFFVGIGEGMELPRRHVTGPVGLVDLAPTLLSLGDLLPSAKMRGHDLSPWLGAAGAPEERLEAYAEIDTKKLFANGNERLICDLSREYCELYDLRADPGEHRNLAGRQPARVAALRSRLKAWLSGQSTFERAPRTGDEERAIAALERARLGDRSALRDVLPLLGAADPALRDGAARALLRLPDDPAAREAVQAAHRARPDEVLLSALALRAGDRSLAPALEVAAAEEPSKLDPVVRAEIALALAAEASPRPEVLTLLGRTLGRLSDEEVARRVIAALGAAHRPEALAPLVGALDDVRMRPDVVRALGELGDRRAVIPLLARIAEEPYVTARAEEARALGRLHDGRARGALQRLLRTEKEAVVRREVRAALAHLE